MLDPRFHQAVLAYARLSRERRAGALAKGAYEDAVAALAIEDAGRQWRIDPPTGRWWVSQGAGWTEARPPQAAAPAVAAGSPALPKHAPAAQPAAQSPSAPAAPQPPKPALAARAAASTPTGPSPLAMIFIVIAILLVVGSVIAHKVRPTPAAQPASSAAAPCASDAPSEIGLNAPNTCP